MLSYLVLWSAIVWLFRPEKIKHLVCYEEKKKQESGISIKIKVVVKTVITVNPVVKTVNPVR